MFVFVLYFANIEIYFKINNYFVKKIHGNVFDKAIKNNLTVFKLYKLVFWELFKLIITFALKFILCQ